MYKRQEKANRDVGRMAAESGVDRLLCIGPEARFIAEEGRKSGRIPVCLWFPEKEELTVWLRQNLSVGDAVLFKASRGMKFEEIISAFYGEE